MIFCIGRSKKGSRAFVTVPKGDNGNVTLIAAVSPTQGVLYYECYTGGTNADRYSMFIQSLLQIPMVNVKGRIIISDNVKFHHSEKVQHVLDNNAVHHRLTFLPPYSPQLNPIECMFSKVKAFVHSQQKTSQNHLINIIQEGCRKVTSADCAGWYRETMRWYVKCADSEPLL